FGVFEHNLRVQLALVLHDQATHVAAGIFFEAERFPFYHVLEANFARDLRENWNAVRVPFAENLARLDRLILIDAKNSAIWHFVLFQLAPLVIEERDFA